MGGEDGRTGGRGESGWRVKSPWPKPFRFSRVLGVRGPRDRRPLCVIVLCSGVLGMAHLILGSLARLDLAHVARAYRFTPRRMQVLTGVLLDQTHADIAKALGIRIASVKTHIQRTRQRLGVHSKAAIVSIVWATVVAKMKEGKGSRK